MQGIRITTALLVVSMSMGHTASAQLMTDADAKDQMKYDIQYLADDRLEGRETGTEGERIAAEYIAGRMSALSLMPYGDSATYIQKFNFAAGAELGPRNSLHIARIKFEVGEDYFPIAFSANGEVRGKITKCLYGIHAPDLNYDDLADRDLEGRIAAISISSPDGIHPHSKYLAYHDLRQRVVEIAKRGALAVLLYNDDPTAEDPTPRLSAKEIACSVPVIFLKGDRYEQVVADNQPFILSVDIQRKEKTARNVIGMVDNGAPNVVVIGAHYDHLGHGIEGSLYRGEPAIHNGADDNASGVAAMLQLATDLQQMDDYRANDYLFIAFSGEEMGLYGSNYWTKHPTLSLKEINYMINLDMVGRLDTSWTIGVNGVGTSPAWSELDAIRAGGLKMKTTQAGVGPSDHSSFYLQDIPAIHYFSGTHEDYHKPSDDEEKINYEGMMAIVRHIEALIATLNDNGKIAFTRTDDANSEQAPRFTVTLGVIPDYMYEGAGMRIDGVTEGKPASSAGLLVGDVVVKMGDNVVTDMMSYMKALSMFKKGDSTRVTVIREGKEQSADVQF